MPAGHLDDVRKAGERLGDGPVAVLAVVDSLAESIRCQTSICVPAARSAPRRLGTSAS
ncbi:MAG: hypothetical protein R3A46_10965 [Thermomicrobiales bacterium]